MATVWRCPRCGSVAVMDPRLGDELVAVYDLCGPPDEPKGTRVPVRMERVSGPAEVLALARRRGEPALTR